MLFRRFVLSRRIVPRWPTSLILSLFGPACALILLLVCFRAVLFQGEQFAYRDSAHFYYPLYLRVQQEWQAGRWPLWNPWQNGGMPLLGMPMAAIFYPGKVIYAVFSYPWATRLYAVGHVALAWAGMFALARAWRLSVTAAGLAALAYAFGAPVLFQYCNIIYLVGAAWVPWGFLALERLLGQKRTVGGLLGLTLVLALQVLGGDPEAAYLTVLCGGGYALLLAARGSESGWPGRLLGVLRRPWVVALLLLGWIAATVAAAYAVTRIWEPSGSPPRWLLPAGLWVTVGLVILAASWWRTRDTRLGLGLGPGPGIGLGPMLAGLAGACGLAVLLAGVQLLPTLEYIGRSHRAADRVTMDIFYFSVEPFRLVELVWPGAFGLTAAQNQSFFQALPRAGNHALWTPSLYLGGLTLALALGTLGIRDGPPWRTWLLAVAGLGAVASFGRFAGPLWWLRWLRVVPGVLGPHDPTGTMLRHDGFLGDGAGSLYGLCAALLPGFGLFRFPGKLWTFVALAVAALAGLGWDLLAAGRTRRPARACAWGLAITLTVALVLPAARPRITAALAGRLISDSAYGPIDLPAALDQSQRALIQGAILLAAGLGLARCAPRQPGKAGVLALVVMSLDLGVANGRLIWTAPQATFEGTPRIAQLIADAERADPFPGPFRIHRMSLWQPEGFTDRSSPRRFEELTRWERATLQPEHGLPLGLSYCLTEGVLEIMDYMAFFRHQELPVSTGAVQFLGVSPGGTLTYFPRRGFDLWNTRYFILPVRTDNWTSPERGYAAFLPETELIYPSAKFIVGPDGASWRDHEDWQVFRNKDAYPRAWLVHFLRVRQPLTAMHSSSPLTPGVDETLELLQDLVYKDDPFWHVPGRQVYDLRAVAYVATEEPQGLTGYSSRRVVSPVEKVTITRYEPQRVEIDARLEHPGLVVLADTDYPGWVLTIDGVPAPIYRTNHLMRGAAVKAGQHTLVYTYDPASFRIGAALTIAGLIGAAVLVPWAWAERTRWKKIGPSKHNPSEVESSDPV
jgi:hypothetical protein